MEADPAKTSKKILVGFDGSEASRAAASKAAELAHRLGHSLWVVYAIPSLNSAVLGDFSGFASAELVEVQRREANRLLQELRKELERSEVRVETSVFIDAPAARLARLAEEDPAVELVVIGATGAGAMARLLLGSVALRLLHLCKKPMLVVPPAE
jgi:nucleotide-binding universal stress UspA family protein